MHLYLMGYRGSGKSTVGRLLAAKLACPLIDTDEIIERAASTTIRQIFEREGESGFRDREQQVIAEVAASPQPAVIALGGGAVLREANQRVIASSGRVVWLQGSAEFLYARISGDATSVDRRPNLSARGGYDEVVEILAAREPVYRKLAQKTVVTDQQTPDEIVAEIAAWVKTPSS